MRMYEVEVIKTGVNRTVTHAAYAAKGPRVYRKIREFTADNNGNEIGPPPNHNQQVRRVEVAAPVVKLRPPQNEPSVMLVPIPTEETHIPDPTNEEDEVQTENTEQPAAPKKRGRKPKSISSSNDEAK